MDWKSHLLQNGFLLSGNWIAKNDGSIYWSEVLPKKSGLYAFASNNKIVYIGVTRRIFEKRMKNYIKGHKDRTKTMSYINRCIRAALAKEEKVYILTCSPGKTKWNGLPVYIAPGLERGLIEEISPRWNRDK